MTTNMYAIFTDIAVRNVHTKSDFSVPFDVFLEHCKNVGPFSVPGGSCSKASSQPLAMF